MSRNSFDPDAVAPPPLHDAFIDKRRPCNACGKSTLIATLSIYGARCFGCYEAYCREPQPMPASRADKRLGPKAWAWALKAVEEASPRRLSAVQQVMWRAALHPDVARQFREQEEAVRGAS